MTFDIYHVIWQWQRDHRRPSWDEYFMMMAEVAATRSNCDRGPEQRLRSTHKGTGAVIVSSDRTRIITGYNGAPPGDYTCDDHWCENCDEEHSGIKQEGTVCPNCGGGLKGGHILVDGHCRRTLHAEENAIINCPFDTRACTIYSTTIPCYECAKKITAARIARVVYQHYYESQETQRTEGLLLSSNIVLDRLQIGTEASQ